ncbi:hypothetical protein E1293_22490 [Actinomadura darangshiensis]|uniref:Uncharacterized protein n=1 Tax=Actinomadura darangshiensis TaxID=705336 RepID=A0A4R5B134_9ACTN|nr:hypothetical protein [Actinomadura darangshiensis]TDD79728.1 hypothetical protein E1293_22490 [Actinomadura darangshiensis]
MPHAHDTVPVTLAPAQANTIVLALDPGITTEPQWGDPRGITDDCLAVKDILGWHDPAEHDVRVALTPRQWDVVVAELDRDALTLLRNGEDDEAGEGMRTLDTVLDQISQDLPAHPVQPATAQQPLDLGDANYYTLFQPPRGGWRTGFTYGRPDTTSGPPIRSAEPGRGLAVATDSPAVAVTLQILPVAPEADVEGWEYVGEISQQWVSHPYPELVLAAPDQEGAVLPELPTQVWPHTVYRVRLSTRRTSGAEEEHRLQLWPEHAAPPLDLKRPHREEGKST